LDDGAGCAVCFIVFGMWTILLRWLLAITVGVTAVLAGPPGAAAAAELGGVELTYLPTGLGSSTDFEYEDYDVTFTARVWESGSDADGWHVDLHVIVMRGDRLSDAVALHDWFIAYEDRPADETQYRPVRIHGQPGWLTADQVFWLVQPGLAVSVRIDRSRWSLDELVRTAWGVHAP
jgi:hypothetical protein